MPVWSLACLHYLYILGHQGGAWLSDVTGRISVDMRMNGCDSRFENLSTVRRDCGCTHRGCEVPII